MSNCPHCKDDKTGNEWLNAVYRITGRNFLCDKCYSDLSAILQTTKVLGITTHRFHCGN